VVIIILLYIKKSNLHCICLTPFLGVMSEWCSTLCMGPHIKVQQWLVIGNEWEIWLALGLNSKPPSSEAGLSLITWATWPMILAK